MSYFFVVPKPGHFGDYAKVLSWHRTVEAARKAVVKAKKQGLSCEVRAGGLVKGNPWFQSDAQSSVYPVVS